MKLELHVPVEQFGFVAAHLEGTAEDAAKAYDDIAGAFKVKPTNSMEEKDFKAILRVYLKEGKMSPDDYEAMSPAQKYCITSIKKAKQD